MAEADELECVTVATARYVVISLAAIKTGLTVKAINRKIEDGVWVENKEWRRGPDGRRYIDMKGYEQWVEKAPALRSGKRASA